MRDLNSLEDLFDRFTRCRTINTHDVPLIPFPLLVYLSLFYCFSFFCIWVMPLMMKSYLLKPIQISSSLYLYELKINVFLVVDTTFIDCLACRYHSSLVWLLLKKLLAVWFIGYLEEQVDIFSWRMVMMKGSLHCLNEWWKIIVNIVSCMCCDFIFCMCKLSLSGLAWTENGVLAFGYRSALRAFRRRVAYSNVGYDRILSVI